MVLRGVQAAKAYVVNNLVAVTSERVFLQESVKLCQGLTADVLEGMAQSNTSVAVLMAQTGHKFPEYKKNPGVDYLMSLTDEHLLAILDRKLPAHVAVLKAHPVYCKSFISDLRRLAGAAAQK